MKKIQLLHRLLAESPLSARNSNTTNTPKEATHSKQTYIKRISCRRHIAASFLELFRFRFLLIAVCAELTSLGSLENVKRFLYSFQAVYFSLMEMAHKSKRLTFMETVLNEEEVQPRNVEPEQTSRFAQIGFEYTAEAPRPSRYGISPQFPRVVLPYPWNFPRSEPFCSAEVFSGSQQTLALPRPEYVESVPPATSLFGIALASPAAQLRVLSISGTVPDACLPSTRTQPVNNARTRMDLREKRTELTLRDEPMVAIKHEAEENRNVGAPHPNVQPTSRSRLRASSSASGYRRAHPNVEEAPKALPPKKRLCSRLESSITPSVEKLGISLSSTPRNEYAPRTVSDAPRDQTLNPNTSFAKTTKLDLYSGKVTHGRVQKKKTKSKSAPESDTAQSAPKRFNCTEDGCTQTFSRYPDVHKHVQVVHNKLKIHECPYNDCNSIFGARGSLNKHVNAVHKRIRQHKCQASGCNYVTAERGNLNKHIRRRHPELSPNTL